MKCADSILFKFKNPNESNEDDGCTSTQDENVEEEDDHINSNVSTQKHDVATLQLLSPVMQKIVGDEAAAQIADPSSSSPNLIDEREVEVINLDLQLDMRFLLHMCEPFFTSDAALAVASNLKQSEEMCDLVLPLYAPRKGQFWLFHCHNSPKNLEEMRRKQSRARIWGQWFDHDSSTDDYVLQKQNDCIKVKSLISSRVGGFIYDVLPSKLNVYRPPKNMIAAVNFIFTSHGYI